MASLQPATPGAANILVVAGGDSPELSVLQKLPPGARCAWRAPRSRALSPARILRRLVPPPAPPTLPSSPLPPRPACLLPSVLAIGQTAEELDAKGLDWGAVDVLLNCGVGKNAGKRDDIRVGGRCVGEGGVSGCGVRSPAFGVRAFARHEAAAFARSKALACGGERPPPFTHPFGARRRCGRS